MVIYNRIPQPRDNDDPRGLPNATNRQVNRGLNAQGDVSWKALRNNTQDGVGRTQIAGLDWQDARQKHRKGKLDSYVQRFRQNRQEDNNQQQGWQNPFGIPVPGSDNPIRPGNDGSPQGNGRPSLQDYLMGDRTYQSQISLYDKELQDYMLGHNRDKDRINEDFGLALGRLGKERGRALENIEDDFAARGMLHSGLYGEDVSEYNDDYQQTVGDLERDKLRSIEDLIEMLNMFQSTVSSKKQNAKLEAIRRRAEELSVSPSPDRRNDGGGQNNDGGGEQKRPFAGQIRPKKDSRLMTQALSDGKVTDREFRRIREQNQRSRKNDAFSEKDQRLLRRVKRNR